MRERESEKKTKFDLLLSLSLLLPNFQLDLNSWIECRGWDQKTRPDLWEWTNQKASERERKKQKRENNFKRMLVARLVVCSKVFWLVDLSVGVVTAAAAVAKQRMEVVWEISGTLCLNELYCLFNYLLPEGGHLGKYAISFFFSILLFSVYLLFFYYCYYKTRIYLTNSSKWRRLATRMREFYEMKLNWRLRIFFLPTCHTTLIGDKSIYGFFKYPNTLNR